MAPTPISLTFQDANDHDLAVRFRVPAVPRVHKGHQDTFYSPEAFSEAE